MKLNINRFTVGEYPLELTSGTDYEKLLCLTVAKQPPLKPPTYSFVNNSDLGYNNVVEKLFQFAYKYVYKDGEHSALSPYSSVAFARNMLKDYFIIEPQKNFFNQIDVYVKNTTADVKEIILYARETQEQTFYEVQKINNTNGTGSTTITFTNNKIGNPLSKEEVLKSYDNVPQKARTLAITNNRLFFGNYTEGYPNINVNVDLLTNYISKPSAYDIPVTIEVSDYNVAEDSTIPKINLDVSSLPSTVPAGSVLNLNFIVNMNELHVSGGVFFADFIELEDGELQIVYQRKDDTTNAEVKTMAVKKLKAESFLDTAWDLYMANFDPSIWSQFTPALSFISEGLYVKESISVDNSTTKADIIGLIESKLIEQTFDVFLNPTNNARRLCVTEHQAVNVYAEKAAFNGVAAFKFETKSIDTNRILFGLKMQHVDIEPFEFFKDGSKPTEIITTNRIRLQSYGGAVRRVVPYMNDVEIVSGGTGVYTNLDGSRSFKSGASHKLGIVYLDDRGRASGVQESGDVFVQSLNRRNNLSKQDGAASVVMKINHNAPSWASKWLPVYVGYGSTELAFMYSVNGAFVPRNNLDQNTATGTKNKIYISVNSLFGDNGFNKSFGSDIDYKFEKGDKLRIIDYGKGFKYTAEFKIVGLKKLNEDEETNPIFDKINEDAKSVTTGEFLIVEDNGAYPFNYSSVLDENSKWFDNCIVEVYRNRKQLDDDSYVYYELGKVYDIENNEHNSERSGTTLGATIDYVDGELLLYSASKFFKGDVLEASGKSITVNDVWYKNGFYYATYEDKNIPQLGVSSYIFNITNYSPAIEITQGDVYFRPRLLYVASKQIDQVSYKSAGSMPAIVDWIEDYSVSDFFASKQTSKGKPYGYITDSKTIRRISSITYSDPYTIDSDRLNLSTFNLSGANWKDMDIEYGQIDKIVPRGDSLTVLQNSKASAVPVGRNLIGYADGKTNLTTSTDVLGKESYYAGNFGSSNNPESVIERFGVVYYTDLDSRKVIRLSADGITPISEKGMDSLFNKVFEDLSHNAAVPKIVGGFDPDNDEYIITVEDLSQSYIYIGSSDPELEPFPYEVELNEDGLYTPTQVYTSTAVIWNNINFNWQNICSNWNDLGNGILNIETGQVLLDSSWYGGQDTIYILITNSSNSFVAVGQINLLTGEIILPSSTCSGQSITTDFGGSEAQGLTIAYKHKAGVWSSKYSFKPTNYTNIGNKMYSFFQSDSGLAWVHNKNETRNNFYGTQYNSMFEMSSNYNPSMIKTYEALGVEGNGSWTSAIETSTQKTSIEAFDKREGHQYGMIRRNTVNSNSHKIYMGSVESVSGNNVSFTTPINRIPFNIGDELRIVVGQTISSTASNVVSVIDRKSLVCSTPVFSVGDNIMIEQSSYVNGDPIRDVFAKFKMVSSDTEPYEVHALSVSYTRSRLHNDRVN
jgi:hypothetical protein